jgi:hypothetical protein
MNTQEIPRTDWPQFFQDFTRRHEGWRCTIEVLGDALGAQFQASGLPLGGINSDDSGIVVQLAGEAEHRIPAPEHVWRLEVDGDDEVLEIEGPSIRTLLRFQKDSVDAPSRVMS